jgi:hypothetical protein
MRSLFSRRFWGGTATQSRTQPKARSRGLEARLEPLESRNLLSGGTVVLSPGLVTVTPSPTGPNTAIVSYQRVNGATMLDVNLNGVNNYFSLTQVGFIYYRGANDTGAQMFENDTGLHCVAWGGSGTNHFVSTIARDEFFGGSGTNTFDAGSGFDWLVGGSGANIFNESAHGSGQIIKAGSSNTVNVPAGATGTYYIV